MKRKIVVTDLLSFSGERKDGCKAKREMGAGAIKLTLKRTPLFFDRLFRRTYLNAAI